MTTAATRPASPAMTVDTTDVFGSILSEQYYSERADPRPGQPYYLVLSDLALAVQRFRSAERLTILDYGSGPSPYRGLFPNADYRRADAIDDDRLDYRIAKDQSIPECSESFDLILSTQVLEHVPEPSLYLAECRRLLRTRGRVVVSTHGTFPEHGLPYDFHRWTGIGLVAALERAGFDVTHSYRLTTNGRALAYLLGEHGGTLVRSRRNLLGLGFWCLSRLIRTRTRWFHEWCDSTFAASRVVDSSVPGHTLTIGLLCVGVKRG